MKKPDCQYTTLDLDEFFCSPDDDVALQAHLDTCFHCSNYLNDLGMTFAAEPNGPKLPAENRAPGIAASHWMASPFGKAIAWGLPACLAAAALFRLGDSADTAYVGAKGSPSVELLVTRQERSTVWRSSQSVQAGDVLALRVACEDFRHVSVLNRSKGDSEPQSLANTSCPTTSNQLLPFTIVVDDDPQQETLSVVLSRESMSDLDKSRAVAANSRTQSVWVRSFHISPERK